MDSNGNSFLIENGQLASPEYFLNTNSSSVSLISNTAVRAQISNIDIFALSNRNTNVTGTNVVPILNILCLANVCNNTNSTTNEIVLMSKCSDGSFRLRQALGMMNPNIAQINANGLIAATGSTNLGDSNSYALLGLPLDLINVADPTLKNGANGQDWPVTLKPDINSFDVSSVAWIAAQDTASTNLNNPRMPQLVASAGNIQGLTYHWKLGVIFYDRFGNPHRDFDTGKIQNTSVDDDTVTIPSASGSLDSNPVAINGWVQITNGSPWNIGIDPDWTNAVADGFFGGVAKLSLMITSSGGSGTNVPQQDYYFRIAGENPQATNAKSYITNTCGATFWYAYAIAKHETKDEGKKGYYNHYLDQGAKYSALRGKEGIPNWNNDTTFKKDTSGNYILDGSGNRVIQTDAKGSGGYGLFQLTYASGDPNFVESRGWLWNWHDNSQQFKVEIQGKVSQSTSLYNGLLSTYPGCGAIPNHLHFTGLESIIITNYNGMSGGSVRRIKVNGYKNNPRTCWQPNSSGTGWNFRPNVNNYVDEVDALIDP